MRAQKHFTVLRYNKECSRISRIVANNANGFPIRIIKSKLALFAITP